jgi:hypothetical protein
MHSQLPFQIIGPGSSASEASSAPTTIGRAPADSETTFAWPFPLHRQCSGPTDGGMHRIIGGIVSIILRRLLRYTYRQYLGIGTPDFATALYMAFSVSTAALTRGAQAATFRGHFPVARKSGQRQVGLPSMLDETPPIPGRWYLQTRVLSSPSRLRRSMRFACQR